MSRRAHRAVAVALSMLAGSMVLADPGVSPDIAGAARQAGIAFGVALGARALDDAGQKAAVMRTFTSVTTENALKWRELERQRGVRDYAEADRIVAFAQARGLRVRGHALIWSRLNGPPAWLASVAESEGPAALRALVIEHVRETVTRYRGRIAQWDVFNEPLALQGGDLDADSLFHAALGEGVIVDAFLAAHSADPKAQLYLNEIGLENAPARFDAFVALTRRLLAAGAPIHGVGMQGHVLTQPPDEAVLLSRFERLAALGLDVEVTELDVSIRAVDGAADPGRRQAESFAAFIRACRRASRCRGVTVWGVHDGASWLGQDAQPLLFDAALRPKPALRRVHDALTAPLRPGIAPPP